MNAKPDSNRSKIAAWREAYGITERQARILVAMVAARQLGAPLGFDIVTRSHLQFLGIDLSASSDMADLERMALVESVDHLLGKNEKWYIATDLAFRRFGLVPPARVIYGTSHTERAEEMSRREDERTAQYHRNRYQRLKESA